MAFAASPRRYRFGAFELQLDERRLLNDGLEVALRPRTFGLLAAMVERAGHLVTKDELLDLVWPKMVVEEAALHVQVSALRKVLGADAIATVSGQGYRFALPVTKVESRTPATHNLPSQLTSFIGREQELAQLKDMLTAHRLVTLTGAGGAGKTRLAIQVAAAVFDRYPDGVWLVELASLAEPSLVTQAVAIVLGLKEQPERLLIDTISEHLAMKRLLLVIDNAEHLLEPCSRVIDAILKRSAQTTILVTSRERVGVAGELTYRVPSLTVPATDENAAVEALLSYEGVRLFIDRARLLRPHFEVTAANAAAIASICSRLDGIPLAIELAAPRLRSMSIDELSQRLDHRFALLTDGSRAALPRHRTLRSMIDWSYDLLADAEQSMLRRASVFAGGWTSSDAEEVCSGAGIEKSAVIDLLTSLVDKNLVIADERDGATRYRMLETVRQYARDRLRETGGEASCRDRHLACFVELGEAGFEKQNGPEQRTWFEQMTAEQENVRAALEWSLSGEGAAEGLRLAGFVWRFWLIRGDVSEGRRWLSRLLDKVPDATPSIHRARVLSAAGILAVRQGDAREANELLEQGVAAWRATGYREGAARTLNNLAILAADQGNGARAERLYHESLTILRELGDVRGVGFVLGNLGVLACDRGEHARAEALLEEALAVARQLDDSQSIGEILNNLGAVAARSGDFTIARARFADSIGISHRLGDRNGVAEVLSGFAELAIAAKAPERAVRIWSVEQRIREEIGASRRLVDVARYERLTADARGALGEAAFEHAWSDGSAMTLDDAVKYALSSARATGQ